MSNTNNHCAFSNYVGKEKMRAAVEQRERVGVLALNDLNPYRRPDHPVCCTELNHLI